MLEFVARLAAIGHVAGSIKDAARYRVSPVPAVSGRALSVVWAASGIGGFLLWKYAARIQARSEGGFVVLGVAMAMLIGFAFIASANHVDALLARRRIAARASVRRQKRVERKTGRLQGHAQR